MFEASTLRSPDLLEAAPDAIVLVAQDGRIALVNAQVERLFGYQREELVGQPIEILVPAAARAVHPMHRQRYLRDPRPRPMGHGMALAARRRDGSEFPAEISLSAIDTGNERLVAAAVRDVTDRHAAAEAQARLASIIESSDDAVMGMTPAGVITSWNAAAERIYGYAAAEIVGEHVIKLVPEAAQEAERELLERISNGERVARFRTRRRRKGGRLLAVSLSLSPVIDSMGTIVGAASVSRDLSEQERAEAKFQGLLEAAPDAIVGVGVDGRIVLANAQSERLLGYRRDELIGQPVEVLVPASLGTSHIGMRDRYFADPQPRPMGHGDTQLTARRRDGSEFPAEISLSSLETEDGLIVSASIRDVTDRLEAAAERERLKAQAERERLEAQLQQGQRLESLGQLAGGVAHDFNNLLAVILNYSAFVEEELQDAIDGGEARWESAHRDIGQIQRAADRAIALTHQLLTFGRREVVRPRVLDVNEVVQDVEMLLRRTIGEHVRLAVNLQEGLWAVRADPGQLEQVLVNLAVNAKHAMPTGGTLSIETDNIMVDEAYAARHPTMYAGPHVRLRVGDTGVGMPSDVVAHAFEPFFTTKPKGEGTGLGLATVYGIITQAGGHVRIYSRPGVGTTVTTMIPTTDERPATAEDAGPAARRTGGGETVLVVEDEDAMREVTRRILERNGYAVLTAPRGNDALATADALDGPLHLLVSDVVMPQMLGKEVAERMRASRPGLRVLFMSGYARPVLAEQGTLEPGVALLSKPFSEDALLAAVREALDTPQPAPEAG
ncbi:MAG TPA: PAS domain S-box protein [Pilimelia sp.]|nr:PAS domain S-box protein [Pilimelia sp.]